MFSRRMARAGVLAGVALAAAACYPDLDWREVRSADGGYTVLMPARPEHAQREVVIGGLSLSMSMASAQREGMAFGAAHADIPADYARRDELLAAARAALVRNIDGRIVSERKVVVDGAAGDEFFAEGTAKGRPMQLAARVFIVGPRYYQVVFVGQRERLPAADVALFLGSFRPSPK